MDFVKEITGSDYYFHHSLNEEPSSNYFKLHSHNAFELYLFLEGNGRINIEGKYFKLNPWDLFFIAPGEFHRVLLESDTRYERKVIRFDYPFIRSVDAEDSLMNSFSNYNALPGSLVENSAIPSAYERILDIHNYNDNLKRIGFLSVVSDLLLNMSRLIEDISDSSSADAQQSDIEGVESDNYSITGERKINEIINYINENLSDDLSLDTISKEFFISKYYLSRIFKEATGSTLGHFIIKKRLLFAKRLLYGGATPTNACFQSGFTDYSSFYKCYKKYMGTSPSSVLEK